MLQLSELVTDFAEAFKAVDATGPKGRSKKREYQAGIGPLTENEAVRLATEWLRQTKPPAYCDARPTPYPGSRQVCDMVAPGQWAVEFKLIRPFGDNGVEAEHWSENILHPYPGNVSSVGDALKLLDSRFDERKALIVFGFEHVPPKIELDVAVRCFELICEKVLGVQLGPRSFAEFSSLIHPCHSHGKVYGWELLGKVSS